MTRGIRRDLAWFVAGTDRLHVMCAFFGGFVLGALGIYIPARVYGHKRADAPSRVFPGAS